MMNFVMPLSPQEMPASGAYLFLETFEDGRYVISDRKIHLLGVKDSGGEGTVYIVDDGEGNESVEIIAKIFDFEKINEFRYNKLREMIKSDLVHCPLTEEMKKEHSFLRGIKYDKVTDFVSWPLGILLNEQSHFVGYLMPHAEGVKMNCLFSPILRKKYNVDWDLNTRIRLVLRLLWGVHFLHSRNILIGDIKPDNFLIKEDGFVEFVDCDSYQVAQYPCPVYTPGYQAEELQKINLAKELRQMPSEYFAIAVISFQIIILGKHPYTSVGYNDYKNDITMGVFPYPFDEYNGTGEFVPKGSYLSRWKQIPPSVQELFFSIFMNGKKKREAGYTGKDLHCEEGRPSELEMMSVIQEFYRDHTASGMSADIKEHDYGTL